MKNFFLRNSDVIWALVEIWLAIVFFVLSNGDDPNFLICGGVFLGMSMCDLLDFKTRKGREVE